MPHHKNSFVQTVSKAVQTTPPCAWRRYYFPRSSPQVDQSSSSPVSSFQHIDVFIPPEHPPVNATTSPPLQLLDPLPSHLHDGWTRLLYVPLRKAPSKDTHAEWPSIDMYTSHDVMGTSGESKLMESQAQLLRVEGFCKVLARLQPRTPEDTKPLNELRSALLLHLAKEMAEFRAVTYREKQGEEQRFYDALQEQLRALTGKLQSVLDVKLKELDFEKKLNLVQLMKRAVKDTKHEGSISSMDLELATSSEERRELLHQLAAMEARAVEAESLAASRMQMVSAAAAARAEAETAATTADAARVAAEEHAVLASSEVARLTLVAQRFVARALAQEEDLAELRARAELAAQARGYAHSRRFALKVLKAVPQSMAVAHPVWWWLCDCH
ncbi:hypothetical protein CYMTET_21887 [Cymbomonas tetramitiformis]|uniref:Uncharacterized protein n=1 Tax=Cymbomonas tetramitiformis TaxID=36881 RepID=A0AAE0G1N1_9CHLO|nr:hypothetical protein CYMTET_21887 [Cymbomonas tetramitiformis]